MTKGDVREYLNPKGLASRTVNSHVVQDPMASGCDGAMFTEYNKWCAYTRTCSFSFLPLIFLGCCLHLYTVFSKEAFFSPVLLLVKWWGLEKNRKTARKSGFIFDSV